MKLCQKCWEQIRNFIQTSQSVINGITVEDVPESECEFWAHKELNRVKDKTAEELGPNDWMSKEMIRKRAIDRGLTFS